MKNSEMPDEMRLSLMPIIFWEPKINGWFIANSNLRIEWQETENRFLVPFKIQRNNKEPEKICIREYHTCLELKKGKYAYVW